MKASNNSTSKFQLSNSNCK